VAQLAPFVGPTGKKLTGIWEKACAVAGVALPRKLIWVTNAALCLPLSKSAAEGKRAVDCCAPRLQRELQSLHSDAGILPMGKWAFYALTGRTKGVAKFQGFYNPLKKLPAVPAVKPKKERGKK
jgi:uracil-DNA glycosylase